MPSVSSFIVSPSHVTRIVVSLGYARADMKSPDLFTTMKFLQESKRLMIIPNLKEIICVFQGSRFSTLLTDFKYNHQICKTQTLSNIYIIIMDIFRFLAAGVESHNVVLTTPFTQPSTNAVNTTFHSPYIRVIFLYVLCSESFENLQPIKLQPRARRCISAIHFSFLHCVEFQISRTKANKAADKVL